MIAILTGETCYLMVVLICISLMITDVEHLSFHVPVGHLFVFFGKMSIQVLCPFFDQVICILVTELYEPLYILDINPLSDIWFAKLFSHSVGGLFILLMVSFAVCAEAF